MAIADGDPVAGRKKANACAPCHGLDGLAKLPNAANLAGESVFYLTKQMNAFRTGDRQDENMSVVAKPLTDQDIADLAAWYSLIEVTVRVPSGG
jgi:cytochrome c553